MPAIVVAIHGPEITRYLDAWNMHLYLYVTQGKVEYAAREA
jgi:hypothetical protein